MKMLRFTFSYNEHYIRPKLLLIPRNIIQLHRINKCILVSGRRKTWVLEKNLGNFSLIICDFHSQVKSIICPIRKKLYQKGSFVLSDEFDHLSPFTGI